MLGGGRNTGVRGLVPRSTFRRIGKVFFSLHEGLAEPEDYPKSLV
jgi:hypothetical protein